MDIEDLTDLLKENGIEFTNNTGGNMDRVYILTSFDGVETYNRNVFASLDKAKEYKERMIKEDINHYGYEIDSYHIEEYNIVK